MFSKQSVRTHIHTLYISYILGKDLEFEMNRVWKGTKPSDINGKKYHWLEMRTALNMWNSDTYNGHGKNKIVKNETNQISVFTLCVYK